MKKDKVYLKHILDAVSDIEQFMQDVSREDFFKNREKQYAVLRALEIIGEATKNLSSELKSEYSMVDWKKIAGMRDKLIHAYFGVNLPLVWETIQKNIPQLKAEAKKALSRFE